VRICTNKVAAGVCSSTLLHRLKNILETYGHPVAIIGETRIGYIVYEDDLQVVAEPFSDTQTSG
jgi:hypothetical protein